LNLRFRGRVESAADPDRYARSLLLDDHALVVFAVADMAKEKRCLPAVHTDALNAVAKDRRDRPIPASGSHLR